MKSLISFCCFLILLLPVTGLAQDRIDPPFDSLQNVANVLVITGPVSDLQYIEQVEILSRSRAFLDSNDFAVIHYEDRSAETIPGLASITYKGRVLKERDEQRYMQSQLRTDDDVFSVVLVLKSGEVFEVWNSVIGIREIANSLNRANRRSSIP